MPRMTPRGDVLAATAGDVGSINRVPIFTPGCPSGNWTALTPNTIIGQADLEWRDDWKLYTKNLDTGFVELVDAEGCHALAAGGGVWASRWSARNPRPSGRPRLITSHGIAGDSLFPLAVSDTGYLALLRDYDTGRGIDIYDPQRNLKHSLDLTLSYLHGIFMRQGVLTFHQKNRGWRIFDYIYGAYVDFKERTDGISWFCPISTPSGTILLERDFEAALQLRRIDSWEAYIVVPGPTEETFDPDGRLVDGQIKLTWSRTKAEAPGDLYIQTLDQNIEALPFIDTRPPRRQTPVPAPIPPTPAPTPTPTPPAAPQPPSWPLQTRILRGLNAGFGELIGDKDLARLKGLGVSVLRQEPVRPTGSIRPEEAGLSAMGDFAGMTAELVRFQMPVLWIVTPETLDDVPDGSDVELLNEPNLNGWTPQQYAAIVRTALPVARTRNIRLWVGCISNLGIKEQRWLEQVLNLVPTVQHVSVHRYSDPGQPCSGFATRAHEFTNLRRILKNRAWIVTEHGYHNAPQTKGWWLWKRRVTMSQTEAYHATLADLADFEKYGALAAFYYQFRDGNGEDPLDKFGIQDLNEQWKKVAGVFKA